MAETELVPFDPSSGISGYSIDGQKVPWQRIEDPNYGAVEHLMMTVDDEPRFSKINVVWNRGVFITTVRNNPDRGIEILLIDEERPLVKDENGQRGHVMVTSIPQGIVRKGEDFESAGRRLVKRETGHVPTETIYLGEVYLDAANSETGHDFTLAVVPHDQEPNLTQHDDTEIIKNQRWLTPDEILELDPPLKCAKALSGIELSRKHFPRLLQEGQSQDI